MFEVRVCISSSALFQSLSYKNEVARKNETARKRSGYRSEVATGSEVARKMKWLADAIFTAGKNLQNFTHPTQTFTKSKGPVGLKVPVDVAFEAVPKRNLLKRKAVPRREVRSSLAKVPIPAHQIG